MRFYFPNLDRPKKAAKRLARLIGGSISLSKVQAGLATALGYRDWHELELSHANHLSTPLDQALSVDDFHRRSVDLAMKLARSLGIDDDEAQYALLASRLTGDRASVEDHAAIRLLCWKTNGRWPSSGMAGTVVRPRISFGVARRLAMLTADFDIEKTSDLVQYVSDNRCGVCVRNEITVPRQPIPIFVPYRLRLAYGAWVEPDGSTVLFSRDYAPMWRLRDGEPPRRVAATTWIKHVGQKWFWDDASAPWDDDLRLREEDARLVFYGVVGLPNLVELLPVMVSTVGNVQMPRRILEELRNPRALAG